MIIYFDASCSGSQIISLLFNIDIYAKDLNLTKSTEKDVIGDMYSKVIEQFEDYLLLNNKKLLDDLKNLMEYKIRRKFYKYIIMTLNYGLTKSGLFLKLIEKKKELYVDITNSDLKKLGNEF